MNYHSYSQNHVRFGGEKKKRASHVYVLDHSLSYLSGIFISISLGSVCLLLLLNTLFLSYLFLYFLSYSLTIGHSVLLMSFNAYIGPSLPITKLTLLFFMSLLFVTFSIRSARSVKVFFLPWKLFSSLMQVVFASWICISIRRLVQYKWSIFFPLIFFNLMP